METTPLNNELRISTRDDILAEQIFLRERARQAHDQRGRSNQQPMLDVPIN